MKEMALVYLIEMEGKCKQLIILNVKTLLHRDSASIDWHLAVE